VNTAMGLAGIVVAMPMMLAVAIAVRITSRGPILFRQKRVGVNGRLFDVLKFRTMYENPPPSNEEDWDTPRDPRVTPIGRTLRRLRLNELPQIFNVVRGDMAIVGPRPERPEYVKVFREKIPFYAQRLCVRPGITGWAQINYEHADSVEDTIKKLEYDLYYIKYLSQSLDLYIIFQTIKTLLLTRGAG
jgi:lipopolysaccharide/colanic/teichoic acid biosynthesis glycosyltransferase